LLSTYNGARFLQAQLDSLLAQSYPHWRLHWRDDGSGDATVGIMRAFAAGPGAGRCIESFSSGPHLGACNSFLALLAETLPAVDDGSDVVAFADQDDVWLPEKLQHAVAAIAPSGDRPVLYCARQYLVDEALRGERLSVAHLPVPAFPASLTQNIATGNTLVMNAKAAALVVRLGRPEGTMHDWWSYIAVSACGGAVIFDPEPCILYRMHKHNLVGSARPLPSRALAALRRGPGIFITMMRRHADALASQPSLLPPPARQDLQTVRAGLEGGLLPRLRALACARLRRRTRLENILFAWWFLTSRPATRRGLQPAHALPPLEPPAGRETFETP
jgi:glycosyltransferase involved in cell wall biosynthesis